MKKNLPHSTLFDSIFFFPNNIGAGMLVNMCTVNAREIDIEIESFFFNRQLFFFLF